MEEDELVILALAVVTKDLELARRIVESAKDGVIEEGEIQETLGLSVFNLRTMLYQMQDSNLVIQLGAKENSDGNFLSFWRINKEIAKSFLLRKLRSTRKELIKRKEEDLISEYYVCAADPSHARLSFDEVIRSIGEGSPTCPVCGAMLEPVDKEKVARQIDSMIELIDRALKILEEGG